MKSRFCPSPTGYMHLGNVRTALFNALLAQKKQGIFLLRIEDTDKARNNEIFEHALLEDLKWLSLNWQEGPEVGGPHQPYNQAKRQDIYKFYYQQLESSGLAYACFCSDQQLAISRKVQLAAGQPPRYAGTCRSLSSKIVIEKINQGLRPTLRFKVQENSYVEFTDLVRGPQRFNTDNIGDFIIRRADGTASFIYCNAIDDALMGVTHALRGEDHLTNTPRQLLILQALQLPAPQYGHISLIVGTDGSPLSKRHGSRSIQELRREGFMPEAINNYLARLGHYYENNDFKNFNTLANEFSLSTLGSAPAHFDGNQLLYWQKEAVTHASDDELWKWAGSEVHDLVPAQAQELFMMIVRSNAVFPQDALKWAKIIFTEFLLLDESAQQILKQTNSDFFNAAIAFMAEGGNDIKNIIQKLQLKFGLKGKAVFQPLRVALTGELHGPEMDKLAKLMGANKVQMRLSSAQHIIDNASI